jgi:hypothetical protein
MEKEVIKDIADNLDMGLSCFIHSGTREIKFIPDSDEYFGMDLEDFEQDIEEIESNSEQFIKIERMDSHESFKMMEDFAENLDEEILKEKLTQALSHPKPFKNFRKVIEYSASHKNKWFEFKNKKLMEWVEGQLLQNGLLKS